mmetsp:Transcript_72808/g.213385  ORF Transcript_72808/g.213385 Transcript_72808/m.213385 type:complete len:243 (-) Transcript_72808:357-1085(-)
MADSCCLGSYSANCPESWLCPAQALHLLLEGQEVVWPVARVEDGEDYKVEVRQPLLQLLAVQPGHLRRRVQERPAAERAQHRVADAACREGLELRGDALPHLFLVEAPHAAPAPEVHGSSPELQEREDLVLRQPAVAEVSALPVLDASDADARVLDVQVDPPVLPVEQLRLGLQVHPRVRVHLAGLWVQGEVAVGAAEHVLLLRDHAVRVSAARRVCVGHVEDGEHRAKLPRDLASHLAPIA